MLNNKWEWWKLREVKTGFLISAFLHHELKDEWKLASVQLI